VVSQDDEDDDDHHLEALEQRDEEVKEEIKLEDSTIQ
jgi:hypothetical protein